MQNVSRLSGKLEKCSIVEECKECPDCLDPHWCCRPLKDVVRLFREWFCFGWKVKFILEVNLFASKPLSSLAREWNNNFLRSFSNRVFRVVIRTGEHFFLYFCESIGKLI